MRIKGPGAGEFSIGSGDGELESPLKTEARHVKETLENFQRDSSTGKSLVNRLSEGFDPSNVDKRIFRNR